MFANDCYSFGRGSSAACCVTQERYYFTTNCDKFAPKLTRWSGNVFERRLIETYISENGTDPVTGEDLTVEDLVELKQARVVRPRPPTLTSIPALLSTFQNEWDALILETYQLKQQLAETRQELSTALYYSDSAEKVIARLQKERDEARDALAKISVTLTSNGANGDAMQVDGQGLPEAIVAKIDQTQTEYVDRGRVALFAPANIMLPDCRQPDESARHLRAGQPPTPCKPCNPLRTRNLSTLEAVRLPSTRLVIWHLLEAVMAWSASTQYHKDRLSRH
jgi:hypothetical protein